MALKQEGPRAIEEDKRQGFFTRWEPNVSMKGMPLGSTGPKGNLLRALQYPPAEMAAILPRGGGIIFPAPL
jgi:hypothetical protein